MPRSTSAGSQRRIRNACLLLLLEVLVALIVGIAARNVPIGAFTLIGLGVFDVVVLLPIGVFVGTRIDARRARQTPGNDSA